MAAAASYNCKVVRQFAVMTVVWGIVGTLLGVVISAQLLRPELSFVMAGAAASSALTLLLAQGRGAGEAGRLPGSQTRAERPRSDDPPPPA